MGVAVEMGAEEAGVVGTDGNLVRFRKGPPAIKERQFHFVTASQGVGGGHDGESKDFTQSNKSLQFSGPSNSRQVGLFSVMGIGLLTSLVRFMYDSLFGLFISPQ